jgi:hypothetical protein
VCILRTCVVIRETLTEHPRPSGRNATGETHQFDTLRLSPPILSPNSSTTLASVLPSATQQRCMDPRPTTPPYRPSFRRCCGDQPNNYLFFFLSKSPFHLSPFAPIPSLSFPLPSSLATYQWSMLLVISEAALLHTWLHLLLPCSALHGLKFLLGHTVTCSKVSYLS